jgi:hypothetical protein
MVSYAEIQHRQEQDEYIKKRLQESDSPYKKEDFPFRRCEGCRIMASKHLVEDLSPETSW